MSNHKVVESFSVTGDIQNFRAFMERLRNNLPEVGEWVSSTSERLGFWYEKKYGRDWVDETPQRMASWEIRLKPNGYAGINAYESVPGKTRVDFLDGYMPYSFNNYSPIGLAFEEFCQWVKDEAKQAGLLIEAQSEPPTGRDALGLGNSKTGMPITKKREWTADYSNFNTVAETFNAYWTQHVSTDRLKLKRTPNGFDIIEIYEGREYQRGEVLFFRAINGDSKAFYSIYAAPPESFFFGNSPPVFPENELENILENFWKATASNAPKLTDGDASGQSTPPAVIKNGGGFMMILHTTLSLTIDAVNEWNEDYQLGLSYHGQQRRRAAWSKDNELLTLRYMTGNIVVVNYRKFPFGEGQQATFLNKEILPRLRYGFEELPPNRWPPGESDLVEKMRSHIPETVEEAIAEFFSSEKIDIPGDIAPGQAGSDLEIEVLDVKLRGLLTTLKIKTTNLSDRQERAANYGIEGPPLSTVNEISKLKQEIEELKTEIQKIKEQRAALESS